jgi:DNA (cytosine-5)-methyltransferase 1
MLTMTDLFAGFGGASSGAVAVPGVDLRIAANHWELAVDVHAMNHEQADHACVDLHLEDPAYFPKTDLLWASPECTKWSQAGGSRNGDLTGPLGDPTLFDQLDEDGLLTGEEDEATRSRLLMFDVLRFAEHHRYPAMIVENVVDIATQPRYARAWSAWRKGLASLGYAFRVVSLNSMHAQALGMPAPQSRDRLYVVAWRSGNTPPDVERFIRPAAYCPRCDRVGESRQAWKNGRTVGRYRAQYVFVCARPGCGQLVEPGWLPAWSIIDWSIPGTRIGDRSKPLADKTRARIAAGIARYWRPQIIEASGNQYDAADPKHPQHGDPNAYYRAWPLEEYLRVLHTQESKALVVPVEGRDGKRAASADEYLRTLTTRSETALALLPFILDRRGEYRIRELDDALSTITANDTTKALVQPPFIAELRGGSSDARAITDALATVTAGGNHHALVTPSGGTWNEDARPISDALRALTTREAYALVAPYYGTADTARDVADAIGTLTTRDRYALVMRNNTARGDQGQMSTPVTEYLRTLTTSGHQSLITPGDVEAAAALVDDCLFRMLEPHEIGAGMAFARDYKVKGTRRDQVKGYGNAVTPPAARDLVGAVAESLGAVA